MASELDQQRMELQAPRTERGMVALIGPLGTCVGIYTRPYAEEHIKEHTDSNGICEWSIEELIVTP